MRDRGVPSMHDVFTCIVTKKEMPAYMNSLTIPDFLRYFINSDMAADVMRYAKHIL